MINEIVDNEDDDEDDADGRRIIPIALRCFNFSKNKKKNDFFMNFWNLNHDKVAGGITIY